MQKGFFVDTQARISFEQKESARNFVAVAQVEERRGLGIRSNPALQ